MNEITIAKGKGTTGVEDTGLDREILELEVAIDKVPLSDTILLTKAVLLLLKSSRESVKTICVDVKLAVEKKDEQSD